MHIHGKNKKVKIYLLQILNKTHKKHMKKQKQNQNLKIYLKKQCHPPKSFLILKYRNKKYK